MLKQWFVYSSFTKLFFHSILVPIPTKHCYVKMIPRNSVENLKFQAVPYTLPSCGSFTLLHQDASMHLHHPTPQFTNARDAGISLENSVKFLLFTFNETGMPQKKFCAAETQTHHYFFHLSLARHRRFPQGTAVWRKKEVNMG